MHVQKSVDKDTVMTFLKISWQHKLMQGANSAEATKCLDKCLEFVRRNMTTMGSALLIRYANYLEVDEQLAAYADAFMDAKAPKACGKRPRDDDAVSVAST